jgi:acyl transferase domain-containing protein
VKTNIGHLEAAAGIASLIKVILMIQHGEVPPHLHLRTPNPNVAWDRYRFAIVDRLTSWPAARGVRRAGVSSFGMSGTNAHVVVEEAPLPVEEAGGGGPERPLHLVALSAQNAAALREVAGRYRERLAGLGGAAGGCGVHGERGADASGAPAGVGGGGAEQALEQLQAYEAGGTAKGMVAGMGKRRRG